MKTLLLNPPRYKTDWQNICAILPAYLPDGSNGTAITYADGTVEFASNRLSWVLDNLLGHLRTSSTILTAQSRLFLGDKARRVPLVLCPDFALVPVKGREAIGVNDIVTGYIVQSKVNHIFRHTEGSLVIFKSGVELTVYDQPQTLRQNIQKTAELVHSLNRGPQNSSA